MSDKLEVVAVAANEPEAALLCQRLAEAGIHAIAQRTIGGPEWGSSGSRYVYVAAPDAERASNLLKAGE
jgi:hypothetical protein